MELQEESVCEACAENLEEREIRQRLFLIIGISAIFLSLALAF